MTITAESDLSGLLVNWDPGLISGKVDNDPVTSFTDSSGGSRHGTGTGTFKTGILNGKPCVRLNSSSDRFDLALTDDATVTIVVVMQKRSAVGFTTQTAYGIVDGAAGGHHFGFQASVGSGFLYYPDPGFGAVHLGGDPTVAQITAQHYASTSSMAYWFEGSRAGALDPEDNYPGFTGFFIGDAAFGGEPSDIDVFQVLIWDRTLTDVEMYDLMSFLGKKFAVAGHSANPIATRGTLGNTTGTGTSTVTITNPTLIAVGNKLVMAIAVDNSGTNGAAPGVTSIVDSRGNTWTLVGSGTADPGAANAGTTVYLYVCQVATAYQAADTIVITWTTGSPPAKGIVVEEWTRLGAVAVAATTATGASTTPSVARTATARDQIMMGVLAVEGVAGDTYTADTDTTAGWWQAVLRQGSGGTTTSGQTVARQYKRVTASGAQTFNPTITSRDWVALGVIFDVAVSVQTISVGRASETDLARTIAKKKLRAVGRASSTEAARTIRAFELHAVTRASETDLARALGKKKARVVGLASETDAARPVGKLKSKAVTRASETDLARPVAKLKTRAVTQAVETDAAQAIGKRKLKAIARADETDLALAIRAVKGAILGVASETDLAGALGKLKSKAVGLASETDLARTIGKAKRKAVALAPETDLARPIIAVETFAVGRASETNLARTVAALKSLALGMASETDLAGAVGKLKRKAVGLATEADLARPVGHYWTVHVGRASETDHALPITGTSVYQVGMASESSTARPIGARKLLAVARAVEADVAGAITARKLIALGRALEADLAASIAALKRRLVGLASETDLARPIVGGSVRPVGRASETDTARVIRHGAVVALSRAHETDLARSVARRKTKAVGRATEADAGRTITPSHRQGLGRASELDIALAAAKRKSKSLGRALETDVALPITNAHEIEGISVSTSHRPGAAVSTSSRPAGGPSSGHRAAGSVRTSHNGG